jgi:pyridoxamine 5'-phosphate oxidase
MSSIADDDPIALFQAWMAEAAASEPGLPNAAALATASADGRPSVRMVLIKGAADDGFVFYTNLCSRKAGELDANPHAALCVHWKSLSRQVRIEGQIEPVDDAEADAYFASRERSSRIGAWASKQSQALAGRFDLEKQVARYTARFAVGDIPRPEFWSGYRLRVARMEFWNEKPFRLHDRVEFERDGDGWARQALYP